MFAIEIASGGFQRFTGFMLLDSLLNGNALIPVIALSGFVLIQLMNGVVITETNFNYPGLGQWAAQAVLNLDYASVLGFAMFTAIAVVVANLLVDVQYGIVNLRIRYG